MIPMSHILLVLNDSVELIKESEMTNLEHLQSVLLMIIKDIDDICQQNNIVYFLLGGSAIGAIRHHGFIPWDDDLDIVMDSLNYKRFVQVCREQLDSRKYYFQEGFKDWPMPFSKIKLKGTLFSEPSAYINDSGESGIFVDVFSMENAPSNRVKQLWQYFCGKCFLSYCLRERGWDNPSFIKKLMMICAAPLCNPKIRAFFYKQINKYNTQSTDFFFFYSGRYRLKNSFFKRSYFASEIRVPFVDTLLPVPVGYDEWLSSVFGDYMTPPSDEKRHSLHLVDVDFGVY